MICSLLPAAATISASWPIPSDRQLAEAVQGHAWLEPEFFGRYGQLQLGHPAEQATERLLELQPGKLCAEAVMHADAECQMVSGRAADVEPVRVTEDRRVAIGGREEREYCLACPDRDAANLHILAGYPGRR